MGNSKSKAISVSGGAEGKTGKLAFEICAVTGDVKNVSASAAGGGAPGESAVVRLGLQDEQAYSSPPITLEHLLRPLLKPGSQVHSQLYYCSIFYINTRVSFV